MKVANDYAHCLDDAVIECDNKRRKRRILIIIVMCFVSHFMSIAVFVVGIATGRVIESWIFAAIAVPLNLFADYCSAQSIRWGAKVEAMQEEGRKVRIFIQEVEKQQAQTARAQGDSVKS